MQTKTPRDRWSTHKNGAKRRGIAFDLTFEEWWTIWDESGHWLERGNRKGKYCMARNGDAGAYAVGNVRIIKFEENNIEQGKFCSEETRAKLAAASMRNTHGSAHRGRRGRILSAEERAKISTSMKGGRAVEMTKRRWASAEASAQHGIRMREWHARRKENSQAV